MLNLREIEVDLEEEDSMLIQLLVALVGEAIFGTITARHRGFQAEMERCLEEGAFATRAQDSSRRSR